MSILLGQLEGKFYHLGCLHPPAIYISCMLQVWQSCCI